MNAIVGFQLYVKWHNEVIELRLIAYTCYFTSLTVLMESYFQRNIPSRTVYDL